MLFGNIRLQKTKIPARGLKHMASSFQVMHCIAVQLQKTKIPARGLKRCNTVAMIIYGNTTTSKNQNPREGIETVNNRALIPAARQVASKNQNPREGIETYTLLSVLTHLLISSKNQNPREGIETNDKSTLLLFSSFFSLQKTKIPARGLKLHIACTF